MVKHNKSRDYHAQLRMLVIEWFSMNHNNLWASTAYQLSLEDLEIILTIVRKSYLPNAVDFPTRLATIRHRIGKLSL